MRNAHPTWLPLAALLLGLSHAQAALKDDPVITAAEAADYIKKTAIVCGVIASAKYAYDTGGRPTYLNFDKPYPDSEFTAVVWGDVRDDFDDPPESLQGKKVCVYGKITKHRGKPQMKLYKPGQLKIHPDDR